MVRDLFVLLYLLLVAQIVRPLPDPSRSGKSHKRREVKHDVRHDERVNLRGHKKQTRIIVSHGKPLHVSKGQSKENDNFVNLEHVLFDREQLKKYVLDYLQTHHGYDQAEKTTTNDDAESISRKKKQSGSYHHDRLESQISSINGKHKHLHNRGNNHRRRDEPLHLDHSAHKRRKLTSKQKNHHQTHNQNHLDKHRRSKKLSLPIYYTVKEEGGKRSYIWSYPLSSDHRAKKRKFKKGGKYSSMRNKEISTKRDAGIKSNLKIHQKARKHENKDANKLSSVRVFPHSRHHGKSTYKKDTGHKKRRPKYRDKAKQKVNDADYKANGKAHKKSNKRDFIAVVPPKTLTIEGFDVERVHPHSSRYHKRKKVISEKHTHIPAKKTELHKKSEDQKVESKRNKASKSHRHEHHVKKDIDGVRKKSQPKKVGKKSKVLPRTSRNDRKKVSVHKSSREQKAARKSSVRSASYKSHPHKHKHHDRGHKKSTAHKKDESTAHRGKKMLSHKDSHNFSPSWKSLDKREIPSWYDDAKFGIFVHWGVYSVPSFDSEWFWYKWKGRQLQQYLNYTGKNFPPGFSYNEFASMFKAEFFDAKQWAELVARSGARYFVFTSKHHEGFTNWNSSVAWNWNSVDIGPHRNIVDELARAFRDLSDPEVRFGLYYSLFEWFNPHYLKDKANGFKTDEYIQAVVKPQLYDLVNTYKPDYLWTDGDWEAEASYWKSEEFLTWLFNKSPVKDKVVVNDRWGRGCRCHHGGVYTGQDRYNPGKLQKMKWENAMTIDRHSWGFRREANLKDYLKIEELVKQLASTVSCGGNLLMNIGPASDGTIAPIFQERLTQMGDWLKVNGDAIYKTRPWRAQKDSVSGDVWYTSKDNHVFAIALKWPRSGRLVLGDPNPTSKTLVRMLGAEKDLKWTHGSQHKGGKQRGIVVHVPAIPVSELPCLWAWVFRLSHVT